jgi:hypothetical protein
MEGSLVAGGAQARASPHLVACTTGGGRTAAQGQSAATMAWRARHVGWHGRASPHDHFGWAAVASCQASCAVALGQYLPNIVHTFSNFEFRYSFNYSRNQFEFPKFVGNYRNFRKIKT